jgi:Asp-tRNA(Asn)/Glu-tRNA(Gln) amidotransferase A subunit family amidase
MHKYILPLAIFLVACAPAQHKPATDSKLNVIELTIPEARNLLQSANVSCQQLTRRYLDRIEYYDQSTKLNAIIYINPNAMQRAQMLDAKFAASGRMEKLHCMPVILKDNFDTADMPTEAGAKALQGSLPPDDAFMVTKLRTADAIIIAKSNMGEWAFSPYNTISSTHGETRNAYDLTRVPAGSSGGTASAIAANFGIIGMGTDTGNSIRGPASHLSLVGIRSTIGATSRDGVVPLLLNRDIAGPLMRTVEGAAIVFSVVAGFDSADSSTLPAKTRVKPDYTAYLQKDGLRKVRVGVLRALSNTPTTDPQVLDLFNEAIDDLKRAGAKIVDPFTIPNFDALRKATGFCSRFPYDLNHYLESLGDAAPVKSFDEIIDRKLYRPENQGPMNWAMNGRDDPALRDPPCVDVQGDPRRKQFLDAVVAAMDNENVDVIIYPSWNNPPRKLADLNSPHGNNSPVIAPHTGQPAITVPMGFTDAGLPAGLQMLARPFAEHKLFQYAYAYEQISQHRKPPQQFGPMH